MLFIRPHSLLSSYHYHVIINDTWKDERVVQTITNINDLDQEPNQDNHYVYSPELNQVIDSDSDLDLILYRVLEEDILLIVV